MTHRILSHRSHGGAGAVLIIILGAAAMGLQHSQAQIHRPPCGAVTRDSTHRRTPSIGHRRHTMAIREAPATAFARVTQRVQVEHQPHPYAVMNSATVHYAGPGGSAHYDLPGAVIKIGLLAPLHGPGKLLGEQMLDGARLAIARENLRHPHHPRIALAVEDSSRPWGQLSAQIVHLIFQTQVIALLAPDGITTHLCEQLANKIGLPVLSLAADPSTTEIALPWIFRLGPDDLEQARLFSRWLYRHRDFHRVALVAEADHDGRMGEAAFLEAAQQIHASHPSVLLLRSPLQPAIRTHAHSTALSLSYLSHRLRQFRPQAVVFWTDPSTTQRWFDKWRKTVYPAPVLLARSAAGWLPLALEHRAVAAQPAVAGIWTVWPLGSINRAASSRFERRYHRLTAASPTILAGEAYDAVHMLALALRVSGANRVRLRDALVRIQDPAAIISPVSFDHAGNDRVGFGMASLAMHCAVVYPSRSARSQHP